MEPWDEFDSVGTAWELSFFSPLSVTLVKKLDFNSRSPGRTILPGTEAPLPLLVQSPQASATFGGGRSGRLEGADVREAGPLVGSGTYTEPSHERTWHFPHFKSHMIYS